MSTAHPYLTGQHLEIQATVHQFAMQEVLPVANQLDAREQDIPDEFLCRLAELGYFGITIAEQYGEMATSEIQRTIICDQLLRVRP
ncbi:MAG: acyl-CoA dehydrogenase family protein [Proteobacteria bacterium]|nr:acyl-CoA dehydrogenase family protein [Pseudomonadota bacterium]